MNYPYNYMQDLQNMRDRIDNQMRQLAQPQPITQNFQISNIGDLEGRYANDINEVKNTFVTKPGLFISKDYSTLWIKDVSGSIRTFKTEEVIELDEKDKQINELKTELERVKGELENAKSNVENDVKPITSKKPTRISDN